MTTQTAIGPKSLTAFKREVRPGTRLQTLEHTKRPELVGRVDIVRKAQSANYSMVAEGSPEDARSSWRSWPKSADVLWCHDWAISWTLTEARPGQPATYLTLRILSDEQ